MPVQNSTDPIRHVVVLMLENRSFDQMLGDMKRVFPEVDGIDRKAPGSNPDPKTKQLITQHDGTLFEFPGKVDFGHEPENVDRQLALDGVPMSGFVDDFRTSNPARDDDALAKQVMAYFPVGATEDKDSLPALHGLARQFTVCDRWFSPVPGPTWPNRFFALCGNSGGWRHMPHTSKQYSPPYTYGMDTLFDRLADRGLTGRVYHQGKLSLAYLLRSMWFHPGRFDRLDDFFDDAKGPESAFPQFAFIEPEFFGDTPDDQHPPHNVLRGDALVAKVYNAIRANDALWESTLLVVVYDEHGGFYDHVTPPSGATPPDSARHDDFGFDRLGVRVPAILVSPWVDRRVCDTVFDHTSVLRYVSEKWGLEPLGARSASANSIAQALTFRGTARTDTPVRLKESAVPVTKALMFDELNSMQEATLAALEQEVPFLGLAPQRAFAEVAKGTRATLRALPKDASPQLRYERAGDRVAAARDIRLAERGPFKVLALHGVGHGDENLAWQQGWRETIVRQLKQAGDWGQRDIEFQFLRYDSVFEQKKYELRAKDIPEAIWNLSSGLLPGTRGAMERGLFDPLEKLSGKARWTIGMVAQWINHEELRDELCAVLRDAFAASAPDLVVAHSLGSLIAYDEFRRTVARRDAAALDGRFLITFGSQVSNRAVARVYDGRVEPLHDGAHGFSHWFQLFNPDDRMFTEKLPFSDERTTVVTTAFDDPPLNHDGTHYLAHPASRMAWTTVTAQVASAGVRSAAGPDGVAPMQVASLPRVHGSRPARRRALLIGINNYPNPRNRLQGCVNDTFLMSSLLQEHGFEPEDIRLVLDERATRSAVMSRLDWLVDDIRDHDLRVLYYSGHGAQIPTYGNDAEPDGTDETLVLHDFDWSRSSAFTDDDFYAYYSHLPYGAHFLSVFDCCHAGGMTRAGNLCRGLDPPDDIRHRALRWSKEHGMWVPRDWKETAGREKRLFESRKSGPRPAPGSLARNLRGLGQGVNLRAAAVADRTREVKRIRKTYGNQGPFMPLLMYACGEGQTAAEYQHGAVSHGAFTYVLAKTLRAMGREPGVPELKELIMKSRTELSHLGYDQRPEFVGPATKYKADTKLTALSFGADAATP